MLSDFLCIMSVEALARASKKMEEYAKKKEMLQNLNTKNDDLHITNF